MNSYFLTTVLLMGLSISSTVTAKSVSRWQENDSFTLQNGKILHTSSAHKAETVKGLQDVADILVFKGKLVALQTDNEVYLLNEDGTAGQGQWISLVDSTEKIATDGSDLFALTVRRSLFSSQEVHEVRVFKGAPGERIWTFASIQVPYACGTQICMNNVITPTVAGRQISFEPINLSGVEDLVVESSDVFAITENGDKVIVSRD